MGKDKEKEKKRHLDSDSDDLSGSSDEQHKKKSSKRKEKDKKKHKKHKHKDKDDDMVEKAKAFLRNTLQSGGKPPTGSGDAIGGSGAGVGGAAGPGPGSRSSAAVRQLTPTLPVGRRISDNDYFVKNSEFTAWLLEDRKLYFNELTSEETHELFKDFTALWNAERLGKAYYDGTVQAPKRLTTHTWKFKGAGPASTSTAAGIGPGRDRGHTAERSEHKKWRSEQKELLDELLPRATGREAVLEKKMARREDAKAREASPDTVRLPGGGDLYGGDDSFAAAKAWEARKAEQQRARASMKADQAKEVANVYQAKEDERMAQFRALAAQGPIVIPKRQ